MHRRQFCIHVRVGVYVRVQTHGCHVVIFGHKKKYTLACQTRFMNSYFLGVFLDMNKRKDIFNFQN